MSRKKECHKEPTIFAAYKGDAWLCMGTAQEVADFLKVNKQTVYFLASPAYHKKIEGKSNYLLVIKVEDDEE